MKKKILVVAAHPDDEVLGCGGTLIKLSELGNEINIIFLADGVTSRDEEKVTEIEERRTAARKASNIMGVKKIIFGDFPDNQMDTIPLIKIVKKIERVINDFQPNIIFTHHKGDLNIDHVITHQAVVTATRPITNFKIETILFFEILSSTEWQMANSSSPFIPNWYEDISGFLERKCLALEAYENEMRNWPHPRSIKGAMSLANFRGSSINVDAAEAFILGRKIV